MGSSDSKPMPGPSHVWQSETPVRFSQNLVETLESSTESDSTRARTLELHIQARVAEELKRLQERQDQTFKDLSAKLSSDLPDPSSPESESPAASESSLSKLSRESVQREISELKTKLEKRKRVKDIEALDPGVERARDEVVKCLRGNDRRPLDCWREVEAFRDEVRRLEGRWVEKVVG